jgi:hypothetical protein
VCRFHVATSWRRANSFDRKRRPCWSVTRLASITFIRIGSFLSWSTYLGFLTDGKPCCYIHHTFLLGFPTGRWKAINTVPHQALLLRAQAQLRANPSSWLGLAVAAKVVVSPYSHASCCSSAALMPPLNRPRAQIELLVVWCDLGDVAAASLGWPLPPAPLCSDRLRLA